MTSWFCIVFLSRFKIMEEVILATSVCSNAGGGGPAAESVTTEGRCVLYFEDNAGVIVNNKGEMKGRSFGLIFTLSTSEAGTPALRKLPCGVACRYTGFAQTSLWRRKPVCRRHDMSTPGVERRYTGFVF